MIWVALAGLAFWLLVLSLVVWALARHLGMWELARTAGPVPRLQYDFDADGPQIGAALPAAVADLVRTGNSIPDDSYLFVFSPGCGTCLEVAGEVQRRREVAERSVFAMVGPRTGGAAEELRTVLRSTGQPLLDGESARAAMRALEISSVPFVVRISSGKIVQKRFLRRSANLEEFLTEGTQDEKVHDRPATATQFSKGEMS